MNQNHYGQSQPTQLIPSQYYKTVENYLKKLAFKLGNTPSATEVKVISCIPIDVSDLQYRIVTLEKQLKESTLEKQNRQVSSHPSRRNSTDKIQEPPRNEYREENIVNNVVVLPKNANKTSQKQHNNGMNAAVSKSKGDSKEQNKKANNQVNTVYIRESDKSNDSSEKTLRNSTLSYSSTGSSDQFYKKTSRESYNVKNLQPPQKHTHSFTTLNDRPKDNDVKVLYTEKPKGNKGKPVKSVYRQKYTTTPLSIDKPGPDWKRYTQTPKFTCSTEQVMNQIKDIFGNVINEFKQNKYCPEKSYVAKQKKRRNYQMQYHAQMLPLNPFFYPVPTWNINPNMMDKLDLPLAIKGHKSLDAYKSFRHPSHDLCSRHSYQNYPQYKTRVKKSKSVIQIHVKLDKNLSTEVLHRRAQKKHIHTTNLQRISEGLEADLRDEQVIGGSDPQYMISQNITQSKKLSPKKVSLKQKLKSLFSCRRKTRLVMK